MKRGSFVAAGRSRLVPLLLTLASCGYAHSLSSATTTSTTGVDLGLTPTVVSQESTTSSEAPTTVADSASSTLPQLVFPTTTAAPVTLPPAIVAPVTAPPATPPVTVAVTVPAPTTTTQPPAPTPLAPTLREDAEHITFNVPAGADPCTVVADDPRLGAGKCLLSSSANLLVFVAAEPPAPQTVIAFILKETGTYTSRYIATDPTGRAWTVHVEVGDHDGDGQAEAWFGYRYGDRQYLDLDIVDQRTDRSVSIVGLRELPQSRVDLLSGGATVLSAVYAGADLTTPSGYIQQTITRTGQQWKISAGTTVGAAVFQAFQGDFP